MRGFEEACRPLPVCVLAVRPNCRGVPACAQEVAGLWRRLTLTSNQIGQLRDEPFPIRDIHLD